MRINLVIPNLAGGKHFLQPPIDFLGTMSELKSKGHDVYLLDNRTKKYGLESLGEKLPNSDIIITTTAPYDLSQMYHYDYRLVYSNATVNKLKKVFPTTPVVLTGIHANVKPDLMLKDTNADYILIGELERAIPNLIEKLENNISLDNIENLVLRDSSFGIRKTIFSKELAQPYLEDLLLPDYASIDLNQYYGYELVGDKFERINPWGLMMGSRGCPYSCKFCHNFWGGKIRTRTTKSIVDEMEILEKDFNVKNIFFLDPNFTFSKKYVLPIVDEIKKRKLKVPWTVQTRFNLVDEEMLKSLSSGNCTRIFYGLETYNDATLKLMQTDITISEIDFAVQLTKKHGIAPSMFTMLGVPGETKEGINNTLDFLRKNELLYIAIVYGPRFGTTFTSEYESKSESSLNWNDLLLLKGKIDNQLDTLTLAKIVRFLRTQNVLRQDNDGYKAILGV